MRAFQRLSFLAKQAAIGKSLSNDLPSKLPPVTKAPQLNQTKNTFTEPAAGKEIDTHYIDHGAHTNKPVLYNKMHQPAFNSMVNRVNSFRRQFVNNLPYDESNQSDDYKKQYNQSPVAMAGNNNFNKNYDSFPNKFVSQANREYSNNMFRHARPPRAHKLGENEGVALYSPDDRTLSLADKYNRFGVYLHELTHGLGASSETDDKRVTYGKRSGTYDPEAEYAAMMAEDLAELKTNHRAHEMAQSTQLPAQIGAAVGSANPLASALGALAGNRGAATLTVPGGNIINNNSQVPVKDNYIRSLQKAYEIANKNNYFNPQSYEDTMNIYPTLSEALPHMALEKQNKHGFNFEKIANDLITRVAHLEKRAYGVGDDDFLFERYMDGGHVWNSSPKEIIEDINKEQRRANRQKTTLSFSPYQYHINPDTDKVDEYDSAEAIRQVQAMAAEQEKNRGFLDKLFRRKGPRIDYDKFPRLPYYYSHVKTNPDGTPGKIDWERWENDGNDFLEQLSNEIQASGKFSKVSADLITKLAHLAVKQADGGAWTREEGQSESGGLNAKGRASLKAQGHDIKAPVTEENPKGERAGRQNSFCARMGGMKKKLTSSETANDPDSRINKALRKWNC